MAVSRFFQVVFGVILALAIFIGAGSLIGFLLMHRMWGQPPRPTFANDDPNYKSKALAEAKTKKLQAQKEQQAKQAQTKPKPTAKPTPKPTPTLEPGAYEAKVTWPEGLSIRAQPNYDSEAVGGIDFDTPVVVLSSSDDGVWDQIRVKSTGEKGWIKAGNVEKTSSTATESPAPENPAPAQ
jgi:hypothetical protein